MEMTGMNLRHPPLTAVERPFGLRHAVARFTHGRRYKESRWVVVQGTNQRHVQPSTPFKIPGAPRNKYHSSTLLTLQY